MALENTAPSAPPAAQKKIQPAWYDRAIDIFKKILEFNYSSYGTKKKF